MTAAARASSLLPILLFTASFAFAAPTSDERREFFTQQRKDKANFEKQLAAESNSRNAAAAEFAEKQRADRVAFMRSLGDLLPEERTARLNDHNAQARADLKAFRANLPNASKNDLEKALEDFDKRAAQDRQSLTDSLADDEPEARAEALRRFRNTTNQKRIKLRSQAVNELQKKRRDFERAQQQKVRAFLAS